MLKQLMTLAAALAVVGSVSSASAADWTYAGSFPTPNFGTGETIGVQRLMSDSLGNLYLSVNAGNPNQYIYKCVAPTTDLATTPTYTQLLQDGAMSNGFQGLAVDSANNFYVAGESGTAGTGTLRKYDSAGNLVAAFGTAGVVNPVARLTGLTVMSNGQLLATTFGGVLYQYDSTSGAELSSATTTLANYVRDIAIKPDGAGNDVIFANQSGRAKQVTGGSVANLAGYQTAVDWFTGAVPAPIDSTWDVRAGIFYNAADDTMIFCNKANPVNGINNKAYVVEAATGNVLQSLGDGTNAAGPNQLGAASDAAVVAGATANYLYIATAYPVVQVYIQPLAAVNEWSLY